MKDSNLALGLNIFIHEILYTIIYFNPLSANYNCSIRQILRHILNFRNEQGMIIHENRLPADDSLLCQQTILLKYHALFVIFEKKGKF